MKNGYQSMGGIKKPGLLCAFVLLFLWSQSSIKAQNIEVDPSYVLDQWTTKEGLPVNNVVDILQSETGYLWLATFDGLVRFDGVDFTVYQSEQHPELPSNRILTVEEAKDGSIWMTTEQGFVVYFKNGRFYHVKEEDGLNGDLGNEFFKDENGIIWIASMEGISTYDGRNLAPYMPDKISGNIQNLFVENTGAVWYRNFEETRLFRVTAENIQEFSFPIKKSIEHLPIYEDPHTGGIWLGIIDEAYIYKDGKLKFHSRIEGMGGIEAFYRDQEGAMWLVAEQYGANRWSDSLNRWEAQLRGSFSIRKNINQFTEKNKLWYISGRYIFEDEKKILSTEDRIYCYLFDREGSLWLGTQTLGLARLKKNLFKTYTAEDGMPWNNVYTIVEDNDQKIWAGTYRAGVGVIDENGAVSTVKIENTAWGGFITSLFVGNDSTVYAGSIGAGLAWISPGEKEFHKEKNTGNETPIQIKGFYEEENGDLWLGTPNGLFRGGIGNWQKVEDERFKNFRVRMIMKAPDGSLWLGTNGSGIARYHQGNFTFYVKNNGFISNLFRSFHITDVVSETEYILWVGSEDLGLIRVEIEGGEPNLQTLTRYGTQIGMLDYAIHSIQEDDFGYFWLNTNRGIFRVEKKQLDQYHRGEISKIKGISFTESDGLMNREGNGGNQSPGITASDGKIWFSNQAGAVVFNPADFVDADNELLPPVIIEELITDEKTYHIDKKRHLGLDKHGRDFEINFTALSLVTPLKNNFRYRLVGLNDSWNDSDGRRTAVYTNIPSGSYTFEVMASNNTGTWNPRPARLNITVEPYFYETGWFNFLLVMVVVVSLAGGFRWRLRSLKLSELKLKRLVAERTRDLKKEQEKTQEQADRLKELDEAKTRFFTNISHELRTPLTLIMSPLQQIVSENADRFDAATKEEFNRMLRNCDRLLRLVDQTLELTRLEQGKATLNVKKIELNRFLDDLVNLFVFIGREKKIEVKFIPESNPAYIYADPDKLDKTIANLISNAIKFTNFGGRVTVELHQKEHETVIKVVDTGIGVTQEEKEKIFQRFYQVDSSETRMHEGSGVGLSLAKDFVELHQGQLLLESEKDKGSTFKVIFKNGKDHFSEHDFQEPPKNRKSNRWSEIELNGYPAEVAKVEEDEKAEDRTTILVVEDNVDMRNFITKILKKDYRVLVASNGREGIEKITESLPDLIIADIMMPKMDGISLNRNLKADPVTSSIPVIFLTAKTTKENRIEGFEEGGDAYLTKPFDPAILKARIQNLLDNRYRLRNLLSQNNENSSRHAERVDPFVRNVLEILDEHYMDPEFNVSELSAKLFVDRSHLLRKLKSSVDMTPSEFIKKYRMEKAAELLSDKSDNISEVAYAIGFKSLSYFSFSFKEYFNISPSAYVMEQNEDETETK